MSVAGDTPVISDLTRLECRVGPLRSGDAVLLGSYDRFFAAHGVDVAGLTAAVCDRAAELRARYGFKTPDRPTPRRGHRPRLRPLPDQRYPPQRLHRHSDRRTALSRPGAYPGGSPSRSLPCAASSPP